MLDSKKHLVTVFWNAFAFVAGVHSTYTLVHVASRSLSCPLLTSCIYSCYRRACFATALQCPTTLIDFYDSAYVYDHISPRRGVSVGLRTIERDSLCRGFGLSDI